MRLQPHHERRHQDGKAAGLNEHEHRRRVRQCVRNVQLEQDRTEERAEDAAERRERLAQEMAELAAMVRQKTLVFQAKAGGTGRLYGSVTAAEVADKLAEVLDYDFIRRSIAERVKQGHIHLQETLVDDVLELPQAIGEQVRAGDVVIAMGAGSIGAERERRLKAVAERLGRLTGEPLATPAPKADFSVHRTRLRRSRESNCR